MFTYSLRVTVRKIRNCVGFVAFQVQQLNCKLQHNKQLNSTSTQNTSVCVIVATNQGEFAGWNNSEEIFLKWAAKS